MKTKFLLVFAITSLNVCFTLSQTNRSFRDSAGLSHTTYQQSDNRPVALWNAQMLVGKGFNYDRGVGFGVRGNFEFTNGFFTGATIIYHIGFPKIFEPNGYGPSVYWGPEVGIRNDFSQFQIEIVCSAGEATYEASPESTGHYARGTDSKFYYSPGIGISTRIETGSVGIHIRYVVVDQFNMWGLYFSIGT